MSYPNDSEQTESIYLERSGKGSRELSKRLLMSPEDPLSIEDRKEAYYFEEELTRYRLSSGLSIEELIRKHTVESPTFFAEAFLKAHVHIEGLEGHLRQLNRPEDVYSWLAQAALEASVAPDTFREMARQSGEYYRLEMAQALLRGEEPNESVLESMPIVIEPKKTIDFSQGVLEARDYLQYLRGLYKQGSRGIDGAKRAFVDIYTKRFNGLVTSDVVALEYLVDQSQLINDAETAVDAYLAMPTMLRKAATDPEKRYTLNKRLDYISNGIGYDSDGQASAVDKSVFIEQQPSNEQAAVEPAFTHEQKEILRSTMLTKEDIHAIFEDILADAELFSSEDESSWSPGRGARAADGLYQVVYHPKKATFAVGGIEGVVQVPNGPRSLYDVVTVGAHELTHINQAQADQELGKSLRIATLKGRRVSMLKETGANIVQRQLEMRLFGESKPVAYAYGKAIQAIESGGDVYDASKAFFEEKQRTNELGIGAAKLAAEAADRVLRIMLNSGTNSQPMSYAEENIMNTELADASQSVRQRATLITGLDLDDQVRLHKYGLLPEVGTDQIDWTDILMKHLAPHIERALETTPTAQTN